MFNNYNKLKTRVCTWTHITWSKHFHICSLFYVVIKLIKKSRKRETSFGKYTMSEKKYHPEPENWHHTAMTSPCNCLQHCFTRPINRPACTQHYSIVIYQTTRKNKKQILIWFVEFSPSFVCWSFKNCLVCPLSWEVQEISSIVIFAALLPIRLGKASFPISQ